MPDYADVLPLLTAACASLPHNALIQSEHLSLFEATSAVEIGEPRMDVGARLPGSSSRDNDDDDDDGAHFDAHMALMPDEVLWVMDTILGCEMVWHAGHALSQSVFTCRYLHLAALSELQDEEAILERASTSGRAPYPVELISVVLRAFCRAALKTCDVAMEELLKRHLYDNEDFVSDKAGASLLEDVEIDTVLEELNEAHDWLMDWSGDLAYQWRIPLLRRIRIRMELLCAVCLFFLDEPLFDSVPGHVDAVKRVLPDLRREQIALRPVSSAFDPNIARKLESIAPPRPPMPPLQGAATWDALEELCDGVMDAVRLHWANSWAEVKDHYRDMASRDPPAMPYIRSLHQSVFYSNKKVCGRWHLQHLGWMFFAEQAGLDDDVRDALASARSGKDGEDAVDEYSLQWDTSVYGRTERLVDMASSYLVDYIACQGKNPPRRYRRLGRLLDSWQMLLERAERLAADARDSAARLCKPIEEEAQAPRTSLSSLKQTLLATLDIGGQSSGSSAAEPAYDFARLPAAIARHHKSVARQVVLLGFELELYAPNELVSVYWYLSTVLAPAEHGDTGDSAESSVAVAHSTMARASLNLLAAQAGLPDIGDLEKLRFERRFQWTKEAGALRAQWQDYTIAVSSLRTRSREDLLAHAASALETMQELAKEAASSLSSSTFPDQKVVRRLVRTASEMLQSIRSSRGSDKVAFVSSPELQDAVYPPSVLRTDVENGSFAAGTSS